MPVITQTQFLQILTEHGSNVTLRKPGSGGGSASLFDSIYGNVTSQTTTDKTVKVIIQEITGDEPWLAQAGEMKAGDAVMFSRDAYDGITIDDEDQIISGINIWAVVKKTPNIDAGNTIFYEYYIQRVT